MPPPAPPVESQDSEMTRITKGRKCFRRQEWMRRATRDENDQTEDLRICGKHCLVKVRKSFPYEPKNPELDRSGRPKKKTKVETFLVPDNAGIKAAPTTVNRGLASDRLNANILREWTEGDWAMCAQNQNAIKNTRSIEDINENVRQVTGLDAHKPGTPKDVNDYGTCPCCDRPLELDPDPAVSVESSHEKPAKAKDLKPKVTLESIDESVVRQCTGFESKFALVAFILVVCNGSINSALQTSTELTWFEEWFVYFQWIWCRENTTEESLANKFGVCRKTLGKVLESKWQIILAARNRWPTFASFEEDIALRDKHWNAKHAGKRLNMWDNTNVKAPDPQDAETNRHWFSHYYDGCCAKGAVFLQPCGWGGTWDLWAGCISDSDYQVRADMLKEQEEFVKQDPVHSDIPFTNVLDKGYRIVITAWRAGRQRTIQPDFTRSDRRFSSREVVRSASVATDRSGNERHVNVCKRAGRISRGLQHHQQPRIIADAWLAGASRPISCTNLCCNLHI